MKELKADGSSASISQAALEAVAEKIASKMASKVAAEVESKIESKLKSSSSAGSSFVEMGESMTAEAKQHMARAVQNVAANAQGTTNRDMIMEAVLRPERFAAPAIQQHMDAKAKLHSLQESLRAAREAAMFSSAA